MAERVQAFLVTMKHDVHDEDVEDYLNAIRMIRSVHKVEPVPVNLDDHMARARVKLELETKLLEVLR